jgi:hypothetical protein
LPLAKKIVRALRFLVCCLSDLACAISTHALSVSPYKVNSLVLASLFVTLPEFQPPLKYFTSFLYVAPSGCFCLSSHSAWPSIVDAGVVLKKLNILFCAGQVQGRNGHGV